MKDTMTAARESDRALRSAGALYLLLTVTSIFGFFVPQTLIVPGNATATVAKIMASESLFRLAVVSSLIATIAFVFLARALYRLLSDIDKSQASLMVTLVMLSIPISFLTALNEIAALTIIRGGAAISGLGTSQVNALAALFLELSSNVSAVNAIFFGLWLFPFGLLVIHSGFIPRILGVLLIVAGCSYLVGSLTFLLSPPYANAISTITTVGYLGELGVVGWLALQAARVQFGVRRSS